MRGLDPRIHISQARHAPAKHVDGRTNPTTRAREHGGPKEHPITKVGFEGALISRGIRRDKVGLSEISGISRQRFLPEKRPSARPTFPSSRTQRAWTLRRAPQHPSHAIPPSRHARTCSDSFWVSAHPYGNPTGHGLFARPPHAATLARPPHAMHRTMVRSHASLNGLACQRKSCESSDCADLQGSAHVRQAWPYGAPTLVMRGLDPRISLSRARHALGKHVDARNKCGHDDGRGLVSRSAIEGNEQVGRETGRGGFTRSAPRAGLARPICAKFECARSTKDWPQVSILRDPVEYSLPPVVRDQDLKSQASKDVISFSFYFFGGGGGGGGGLTAVPGLRVTPFCKSVIERGCCDGGGVGSFAMACSAIRISYYAILHTLPYYSNFFSRNSTISTSSADIRIADTPSIDCRLLSINHSPSAMRKCPSSGRLGHSSGQPKRRRCPLKCNTT